MEETVVSGHRPFFRTFGPAEPAGEGSVFIGRAPCVMAHDGTGAGQDPHPRPLIPGFGGLGDESSDVEMGGMLVTMKRLRAALLPLMRQRFQ